MSNPTTGPEVIVADVLVAAGVATKGTNLFHGPEVPRGQGVPDKAIFAVCTGGPPPEPYLGGEDWREFSVQVLTRGEAGGFSAGLTLARSAWLALHRGTLTAGQIALGYIARGSLVRESDPVYIGRDDLERPRWVSNARLWFKG